MGGYGSGRPRGSGKDTVEGYRRIDVRDWHRRELLQPGTRFSWGWWREGEQVASIMVQVGKDCVTLEYRYRFQGGEWQDVEEAVPLTWTHCNYGGARPWFRCPGEVNGVVCDRRAAILYGPGRYFLCRHCYGLVYDSQREDRASRLMSKAHKIQVRLGGEPGFAYPFPPKPKGMHWKTYSRLYRQYQEAEEASWVAAAQKFRLSLGIDAKLR